MCAQSITVGELVAKGVLERPMDGNHGEIHPKGHDFVDHGIPFVMASDLTDGRVDLAPLDAALGSDDQPAKIRSACAQIGCSPAFASASAASKCDSACSVRPRIRSYSPTAYSCTGHQAA